MLNLAKDLTKGHSIEDNYATSIALLSPHETELRFIEVSSDFVYLKNYVMHAYAHTPIEQNDIS